MTAERSGNFPFLSLEIFTWKNILEFNHVNVVFSAYEY